jgi:putative addiction module killer protein
MYLIQKTEQFADWVSKLKDSRGKLKIIARTKRAELGNFGDHHGVGDGVAEMRIDYGPGYRIYFTKRKMTIVILLIGGDKGSQVQDVKKAKQLAKEIGD